MRALTKNFDSMRIEIDSSEVRCGKLPGDTLDYEHVQTGIILDFKIVAHKFFLFYDPGVPRKTFKQREESILSVPKHVQGWVSKICTRPRESC